MRQVRLTRTRQVLFRVFAVTSVLSRVSTTRSCFAAKLLIDQPLTLETLQQLELATQFENLTPRFGATVPQCWSEIHQEQQQRRHPQHLHRHGDTNLHTRTWKLLRDRFAMFTSTIPVTAVHLTYIYLFYSTSFDEHVFEIILPRVTTVGHVDLKFSFNVNVTTSPRIQVMLYQQKLAGFSAPTGHAGEVDWKIDFNLKSSSSGAVKPANRNGLQLSCTIGVHDCGS